MKITQPLSEERAALRADREHPLMNATNAEIDAWIDANVGTLAQARAVLKLILRLQRNTLRRVAQI